MIPKEMKYNLHYGDSLAIYMQYVCKRTDMTFINVQHSFRSSRFEYGQKTVLAFYKLVRLVNLKIENCSVLGSVCSLANYIASYERT